jgi:hypothetical protein
MNPNHTLPARPPPLTYSAPPARSNNAGFAGFSPQASAVSTNYSPAPVSAPYPAPAYPTNNAYNNYSYPAYATGAPSPSYPVAAPAMNHGSAGTYNPEEQAQIAEWNSAYNAGDAKKGGNTSVGVKSEAAAARDAETKPSADGKRKTVVREGGGKTWEDESLLEWDPQHPRLFIGNLAGEVTDESLLKAFAKYPSLTKARVVRDKKSTKSKSYGFVSFSDTDDYFRAAKEMNGKYIGSHPVLIKRATSEVKAVTKREDKNKKNFKNNKNNSKDKKAGTNDAPPVPAPNPTMFMPRGVQKQKKGKANVPRVLG